MVRTSLAILQSRNLPLTGRMRKCVCLKLFFSLAAGCASCNYSAWALRSSYVITRWLSTPPLPLQQAPRTSRFPSEAPPAKTASPAIHIPAMSNSSDGSWSGNPNSPQFFPDEYISEKDGFTGILICAIFHGSPIWHAIPLPHLPRLFGPSFQELSSLCSCNVWGRCLVRPVAWRGA